jgi:hypothetical protein
MALWNQNQTRIIFSPEVLVSNRSLGKFRPGPPSTLLTSNYSMLTGVPGSTMLHELLHGRFTKELFGGRPSSFSGFIKRETPLSPQHAVNLGSYSTGMLMEELVTHISDLSWIRAEIERDSNLVFNADENKNRLVSKASRTFAISDYVCEAMSDFDSTFRNVIKNANWQDWHVEKTVESSTMTSPDGSIAIDVRNKTFDQHKSVHKVTFVFSGYQIYFLISKKTPFSGRKSEFNEFIEKARELAITNLELSQNIRTDLKALIANIRGSNELEVSKEIPAYALDCS